MGGVGSHHCVFFQVTTTNQTTAKRAESMEPLKTLGGYRQGNLLGWDADPSWKHLVFFGEQPELLWPVRYPPQVPMYFYAHPHPGTEAHNHRLSGRVRECQGQN